MTRGRMADNAALAHGFADEMRAMWGETRFARQELDGELIEDAEGSLWPRDLIEACRAPLDFARDAGFARVVVGVDPPASASGDACGIVVVAKGRDEVGYVLEDATVAGRSPDGWARAVAGAAERWGADRVVAEVNQGGDMVESVLRGASVGLPLRKVHASRGKVARAEPVAALYEKGRMKHAGCFPELEDQLAGFCTGGYAGPGRSPDRADALIWAASELLLGGTGTRPRITLL